MFNESTGRWLGSDKLPGSSFCRGANKGSPSVRSNLRQCALKPSPTPEVWMYSRGMKKTINNWRGGVGLRMFGICWRGFA